MKFAVNSDTGDVIDATLQRVDDVDRLGVFAAFQGLCQALRKIGIGPKSGPMPVALAMDRSEFDKLRDAMLGADEFSRRFFQQKDCRGRKRRGRNTMIAGIAICGPDD